MLIQVANSDAYIFNQEAAGDLIIGTAGGSIEIVENGNIGINTLSAADPTGKLDINSTNIRIRTASSPAAAAACNTGEISWDADYIYVCTASGAWKRAALTGGY